MIDLVDRSARDVPAAAGRLSTTERLALTAGLDPAWRVSAIAWSGASRSPTSPRPRPGRRPIAPLADAEDHHPELVVAWGRVDVTLTTHDVDGLSERDLIVAAKLDRAYATRGSSR
jgi:hypothetical protein